MIADHKLQNLKPRRDLAATITYIKDPKAKIPATKMIFAGIKNEKEANDLWAFLAQYDKDGKIK